MDDTTIPSSSVREKSGHLVVNHVPLSLPPTIVTLLQGERPLQL